MKKIIRIFTVIALVFESSLTSALNQTAVHLPSSNVTSETTSLPSNHKNSSKLLDANTFEVSSSLQVAESRQFPVGTPDLIPSSSNLVSPFDASSFGQQLLPLLSVNIKEKVKDFANSFNSGADYVEDVIRESWRESPLNPHNFKHILDPPKLFKHLPFPPASTNGLRKPVHPNHFPKAPHKHREKAPKAIETYSHDSMLHDYGINGYRHFEDSILRELEKQEELKVEATIHTLFEHDQGKDRLIEIIQGKPYDFKTGWKPVAAPTKTYDDSENINSQIVSPLHTSIFSAPLAPSTAPHGFHDFDSLNGNTIHSTYDVHEEEGESKVKLVKTKINSVRKVAPSPSDKSRYRKRHNNQVIKSDGQVFPDSSFNGSHDAPRVVVKAKRNSSRHILSLTTPKPRNHSSSTRNVVTTTLKSEVSTEKLPKASSYGFHKEITTRLRQPTFPLSSSSSTTTSSTTTTTVKPARNVVPREVAKYVDRTKSTGFRGSVKFGQTTTKKPI